MATLTNIAPNITSSPTDSFGFGSIPHSASCSTSISNYPVLFAIDANSYKYQKKSLSHLEASSIALRMWIRRLNIWGGDVVGMKADIVGMKVDIVGIQADVAVMKADIVGMNVDVAGIKESFKAVENSLKEILRRIPS
ncbi:hypothetical protein BDR04DRAFT_1122987 [Suillus decipiens]|nr:hypothetical protein BDR04DRAFT_1122987 [Suillus decipiens]